MIGLILLIAVAFVSAQELDFHGDPFALPPYSWKQLDITWNKVKKKLQTFTVISNKFYELGTRRYLVCWKFD